MRTGLTGVNLLSRKEDKMLCEVLLFDIKHNKQQQALPKYILIEQPTKVKKALVNLNEKACPSTMRQCHIPATRIVMGSTQNG
jgi:uncharacterized protein YeaC (DUF1315 family)